MAAIKYKDPVTGEWKLVPVGVSGNTSSITNIQVNDEGHLIFNMADGSQIDAGDLPDAPNSTIFNTRANFPNPGDPDILYIATDEGIIYRYDSNSSSYVAISNNSSSSFEWSTL